MKTNKRRFLAALTASALALTPCFAAGMSVFAAATAGTSTLSITDSDTASHTYNAYQIITGEQQAGKLKNLQWGSAIPSASRASFIGDLNTLLGLSGTSALASDASVQTVAEALSTINNNADKSIALAKIIQGYVDKTNEAITMDYSSGTYSASNLADGWYLILDETQDLSATDPDTVRSANILKLIGNTNINAKHSLPTLEKKIVENSTEVDANSAAIGDVVTYNIKLKVPDVRGYEKYFYVVEDTLSSGLTYNNDLAVTIGDPAATVVQDTDGVGTTVTTGNYYVTHDGNSIKVVFKDAATYFKDKTVDDPIVITYTATLNSNAVIGDSGNPNTARLVYSNEPNEKADGTPAEGDEPAKPDEPGTTDGDVTGETPWDDVITYSTAIKVIKNDQANQILKGAVFTLTSSDFNEVRVVSGYSFVQNDDAATDNTYYKLKDGSYTKTAPTGAYTAESLYDETNYNKKFNKVYSTTGGTIMEKAGSGSYAVEAQVDENGVIKFEGLKPGTYMLHETVVPEGYNAAPDVEIKIDATYTSGVLNAPSAWSGTHSTYSTADNAFALTVINRQGATLPETGGMGTKLFYVFGSLFVIGGATFMVTKKRVGNSK